MSMRAPLRSTSDLQQNNHLQIQFGPGINVMCIYPPVFFQVNSYGKMDFVFADPLKLEGTMKNRILSMVPASMEDETHDL